MPRVSTGETRVQELPSGVQVKLPGAADSGRSPSVPDPEPSDEALLRQVAVGDSASFDTLFARYGGMLLAFLSRLTTGRVDPEDLLQETFLRVLTHAKDFRSGAAIRPWLFTIARNVALNAMQKSRLRSGLEIQTDLADWQPPERAERQRDPSLSAEVEEQKERLLGALEALPPAHREVIVLVVFNGFSYEEVAAITGDPESTLRSRVFHALRKLRDVLKERR